MLVRVFGCQCIVPNANVTDASFNSILGGNITVQDLENYNAKITFPLVTAMKVENDMFELFSPPPPASGAVFFLIYIIKERLETLSSMESYLPISDRHAASWIFSDGPRKTLGFVKLRYNALKLFFIISLFNANVPLSARFSFPSFMSHEIFTRFNIYVWSILIISIHF